MNIGVVDWFGGNSLNYGFIKPLKFSQAVENLSRDIYVNRSDILNASYNLNKDDVVVFDLKSTPKGWAAVKVRIATAEILAAEINFADAEEYKKFREALKLKLFSKIIAALPKDLFRQYSWLREELPAAERLNLCVRLYETNPASELTEEILSVLKASSLESADWQALAKILVTAINFSDAEEYRKFRADFRSSKPKLFSEVIAALPKDLFRQYSWLREELPAAERLNLCVRLYETNPAPELTEEIWTVFRFATSFSWKNLPREFLADERFVLEISRRVTDAAELEEFFSRVPKETALSLKLWIDFTPKIKLVIFKSFIDEFSEDERKLKIDELIKSDQAAEVTEIILASKNWAEILSACTRNSANKLFWAKILLKDIEKFRQVDAAEDTLILMMYLAAKNDKISDELIEALADKVRPKGILHRAKMVYAYFRAGYDQTKGNFQKRDELLHWVENYFAYIFNLLAKNLENETVLPGFLSNEAFMLPPCTNPNATKAFSENRTIPRYFCEAVTWSTRMKDALEVELDENGEEIFKAKIDKETGETVKVPAPCNYCPRLGVPDDSWTIREKKCCRIEPNLNLPAEKWSLVELVEKLGLKIFHNGEKYAEKNNREFFTRLGGEFNRLYELREHLKCRTCGEYMRSARKTLWRTVKNLFQETLFEHFAVFSSTTFQCKNPDCSDKDGVVYLSYCWHCKSLIDSRDSHVKIKGYYLCESCGAGYKDSLNPARQCLSCGQSGLQLISTNFGAKLRCANCGHEETLPSHFFHAIFPATLCPHCLKCDNCGGVDFEITGEENAAKLKCTNCRKEFLAPLAITQDENSDSSKNFRCSKCGRLVQMEKNDLERQEKRNSLKNITWAK